MGSANCKRNVQLFLSVFLMLFVLLPLSSCSRNPSDEVIEKAVLKARYSNIENKEAMIVQRGEYNKDEKTWSVRVIFSILNKAGTGIVQPNVYEYKIRKNDFREWEAKESNRYER